MRIVNQTITTASTQASGGAHHGISWIAVGIAVLLTYWIVTEWGLITGLIYMFGYWYCYYRRKSIPMYVAGQWRAEANSSRQYCIFAMPRILINPCQDYGAVRYATVLPAAAAHWKSSDRLCGRQSTSCRCRTSDAAVAAMTCSRGSGLYFLQWRRRAGRGV